MSWYALVLPVFCLLVAVIELDNVHVGQCMVSRPIVLGPVLGALFGVPWLGLAGGALVELFCVDVLPVGNALPVNGSVATASFLLLAAGPSAVPASAAFPAGMFLGGVFRSIENGVRSGRVGLARAAAEAAEAGEPVRFGRIVAKGLAWHAGSTAAFLYAAVLLLGPVLDWGWAAAPEPVKRGLDLAYMNAPWLGLGALLYALRPRG